MIYDDDVIELELARLRSRRPRHAERCCLAVFFETQRKVLMISQSKLIVWSEQIRLPRLRQGNAHPPPCLEQTLTTHDEGDGS
jgi:hypothetical protein